MVAGDRISDQIAERAVALDRDHRSARRVVHTDRVAGKAALEVCGVLAKVMEQPGGFR